jgi:uncharacterized protein (UPF0548 family)
MPLAVAQSPSFANAVTYKSGGFNNLSIVLAVADVNGDSKPDLVVSNNCVAGSTGCTYQGAGSVSVLLGNGDGTFQPAVSYASGGNEATSVAVADVNADSKPDIIVTNGCMNAACANGAVAVLLGNGDGTFQAAVSYNSGDATPTSVAVGDVNGDGKPDLLVVGGNTSGSACFAGLPASTGSTVSVLLGNGDGTFQTAVSACTGGWNADFLTVADVNGDGKLDVLVANQCSFSSGGLCGGGNVGVLLGKGDGTFQTAVVYESGGYEVNSVAVADVNGDSKPDLVVSSPNLAAGNSSAGAVSVLLGNGDGTFQPAVAYNSGGKATASVSLADVNGDGKLDAIAANWQSNTVTVLLGNGDGTFQTAVSYSSGGLQSNYIAAADVNADGKPDLIVGNECDSSSTGCQNGSIGVLLNTTLSSSAISLTSSPNPSTFGQAVVLTAAVTALAKGQPTGTVSFADGTTSLGSSALNSNGTATLSITTLAAGTHSIKASYSGDSKFSASTSQPVSQVVMGVTVTANPTSLTVSPGANGTVTITVTPEPPTGFAPTVNVTCTGAPSEATCTLSSPSLVLNGPQTTTLTVSTTAAHSMAERAPMGALIPFGLFVPVACAFGFAASRKHARRGLGWLGLTLLLTASTLWLSGCGGSSSSKDPGTPAGTYTLTVTVTSNAAPTFTQTQKVTLTVQ